MTKEINRETLDFIFDATRDGPRQQLRDVEALDNKMVQVFGAASVIIGLGGLSSARSLIAAVFLFLALVAYAYVGVQAFQHLSPRLMRRSIQADNLWQKGWSLSVSDLKHTLVKDVAAAYVLNKGVITDKGKTLHHALFGITAEVLFVGIAAVARLS